MTRLLRPSGSQTWLLTAALALVFHVSADGHSFDPARTAPEPVLPSTNLPDHTPDCGAAGGQIAINACYRARREAADAAMERARLTFLRHFIPEDEEVEPPIVEEQQAAQAAFLAYRDTHCETLAASQEGGSATAMVVDRCLAELTEMRTRQFQAIIELY